MEGSVSPVDALQRLYEQVEQRVRELCSLHASRLVCRKGCHNCCVDGLTIFEIEAENIRQHHADLLLVDDPHPQGACVFLDRAGACRIYEHRPYVCRTQGLPLRWIDTLPDRTPVEMRDICPLNGQGEPLESLPEGACWTIGPFEGALARMQAKVDGGALRRVPLRAMFRRS
jgi:uncharacterized protein